MISQKLTLLCKSITAQKTDFLSSPSTSTRGAEFLSCHSPSQPHGPAGCIRGAYCADRQDPLRSSVPSPTTSAPQCPPAPPTPNAQHPTARCCAFSLGLRSLPARWACFPPRAKNNRANCNLPGSFLNHTRRTIHQPLTSSIPTPSLVLSPSRQVVKRPAKACTTTCTTCDRRRDPVLDLANIGLSRFCQHTHTPLIFKEPRDRLDQPPTHPPDSLDASDAARPTDRPTPRWMVTGS